MELQKINEALNSYIRPDTFPVAAKMISSAGEIPEKARMPKRDLGVTMPVCQGIALARRYGWLMAMGKEDMLCPLGAVTLGLVPAKAKFLDGSFNVPNWVPNQEIRAKFCRELLRLDHGKYTHLIAAPLHRADFEPQVIIVYGNPAQILRLIQSAVRKTGAPLTSSILGGVACATVITKTILSDDCQFVMAGAGDRIFTLTQDHEVCFTIPMSKVDLIIQGLETTHEAGLRYPTTPSFLRSEVGLPPSYTELMDYLKQSD